MWPRGHAYHSGMTTHTHRNRPHSISLPAAGVLAALVLSAAASDVVLHPELTRPVLDQTRNAVAASQAYVEQSAAQAGHALRMSLPFPSADVESTNPSTYPTGYDQFSPFDSYFGRSTRV